MTTEIEAQFMVAVLLEADPEVRGVVNELLSQGVTWVEIERRIRSAVDKISRQVQ